LTAFRWHEDSTQGGAEVQASAVPPAITYSSFADLRVDEIAFNTGTDDLNDVKRLADVVF